MHTGIIPATLGLCLLRNYHADVKGNITRFNKAKARKHPIGRRARMTSAKKKFNKRRASECTYEGLSEKKSTKSVHNVDSNETNIAQKRLTERDSHEHATAKSNISDVFSELCKKSKKKKINNNNNKVCTEKESMFFDKNAVKKGKSLLNQKEIYDFESSSLSIRKDESHEEYDNYMENKSASLDGKRSNIYKEQSDIFKFGGANNIHSKNYESVNKTDACTDEDFLDKNIESQLLKGVKQKKDLTEKDNNESLKKTLQISHPSPKKYMHSEAPFSLKMNKIDGSKNCEVQLSNYESDVEHRYFEKKKDEQHLNESHQKKFEKMQKEKSVMKKEIYSNNFNKDLKNKKHQTAVYSENFKTMDNTLMKEKLSSCATVEDGTFIKRISKNMVEKERKNEKYESLKNDKNTLWKTEKCMLETMSSITTDSDSSLSEFSLDGFNYSLKGKQDKKYKKFSKTEKLFGEVEYYVKSSSDDDTESSYTNDIQENALSSSESEVDDELNDESNNELEIESLSELISDREETSELLEENKSVAYFEQCSIPSLVKPLIENDRGYETEDIEGNVSPLKNKNDIININELDAFSDESRISHSLKDSHFGIDTDKEYKNMIATEEINTLQSEKADVICEESDSIYNQRVNLPDSVISNIGDVTKSQNEREKDESVAYSRNSEDFHEEEECDKNSYHIHDSVSLDAEVVSQENVEHKINENDSEDSGFEFWEANIPMVHPSKSKSRDSPITDLKKIFQQYSDREEETENEIFPIEEKRELQMKAIMEDVSKIVENSEMADDVDIVEIDDIWEKESAHEIQLEEVEDYRKIKEIKKEILTENLEDHMKTKEEKEIVREVNDSEMEKIEDQIEVNGNVADATEMNKIEIEMKTGVKKAREEKEIEEKNEIEKDSEHIYQKQNSCEKCENGICNEDVYISESIIPSVGSDRTNDFEEEEEEKILQKYNISETSEGNENVICNKSMHLPESIVPNIRSVAESILEENKQHGEENCILQRETPSEFRDENERDVASAPSSLSDSIAFNTESLKKNKTEEEKKESLFQRSNEREVQEVEKMSKIFRKIRLEKGEVLSSIENDTEQESENLDEENKVVNNNQNIIYQKMNNMEQNYKIENAFKKSQSANEISNTDLDPETVQLYLSIMKEVINSSNNEQAKKAMIDEKEALYFGRNLNPTEFRNLMEDCMKVAENQVRNVALNPNVHEKESTVECSNDQKFLENKETDNKNVMIIEELQKDAIPENNITYNIYSDKDIIKEKLENETKKKKKKGEKMEEPLDMLVEHFKTFLCLQHNDVRRNKKIKKYIITLEEFLVDNKSISAKGWEIINPIFEKLFDNIENFSKRDISYRTNKNTNEEREKIKDQVENEINSGNKLENNINNSLQNMEDNDKTSKIYRKKQENEEMMDDILFGLYNSLYYLILINFHALRLHLTADKIYCMVIAVLRHNLDVFIKLSENDVKHDIIEFYNIHFNCFKHFSFIYEKSFKYLNAVFLTISTHDCVMIQLIDLCLSSFIMHRNIQTIILYGINMLLKVYNCNCSKQMKKYVLDSLLASLSDIDYKYNKFNFKNDNEGGTFIHLSSFLLIKIVETFATYDGDIMKRFTMEKERNEKKQLLLSNIEKKNNLIAKKKKNSEETSRRRASTTKEESTYFNALTELDQIQMECESNTSTHVSIFSNDTDLLQNIKEQISNLNGKNEQIEAQLKQLGIRNKRTSKSISKQIEAFTTNERKKEKMTQSRCSLKNSSQVSNNTDNYTDSLSHDIMISKNHFGKPENSTGLRYSTFAIGDISLNSFVSETKNGTQKTFNNLDDFLLNVNFNRIYATINYIFIELFQLTKEQGLKHSRVVLQNIISDIIICCDNPVFNISVIFIRCAHDTFTDVIKQKQEVVIKETALSMLKMIYKFTFNVYNFINNSCFPLLYNFSKELKRNKYITPDLDSATYNSEELQKENSSVVKGNMPKKGGKNRKSKEKHVAAVVVESTDVFNQSNIDNYHGEYNTVEDIQGSIMCCAEKKLESELYQCEYCENFFHADCIFKNANKVKLGNININEYPNNKEDLNYTSKGLESNAEFTGKNSGTNVKESNIQSNALISNKKFIKKFLKYKCDNCKIRELAYDFVLREAQELDTYLNRQFRKELEQNISYCTYRSFVNGLDTFTIYFYYMIAHINNKMNLNELIENRFNHSISFVLLMRFEFANVLRAANTKKMNSGKANEKKTQKKRVKQTELEKKEKDEQMILLQDIYRLNDFLIYESKHVNSHKVTTTFGSTKSNQDLYINNVWKLYLYFFLNDFFYKAFNNLFQIIYENNSKNLRYQSISIVQNIINDNYLYLKCKHVQRILFSCFSDNYLKVRECTLNIYYNFCKTFLNIEFIIQSVKDLKEKMKELEKERDIEKSNNAEQLIQEKDVREEQQYLETQSPKINENNVQENLVSNNTPKTQSSGRKRKSTQSAPGKKRRKSNTEKAQWIQKNKIDKTKGLEESGKTETFHNNFYTKTIDLTEFLTPPILYAIQRCSRDINVNVRLSSIKILKYLIYFNIYIKDYQTIYAIESATQSHKYLSYDDIFSLTLTCDRKNVTQNIFKKCLPTTNDYIVDDLIDRYTSSYDNENVKNTVIETFIDHFFVDIFAVFPKEQRGILGSSFLDLEINSENMDSASIQTDIEVMEKQQKNKRKKQQQQRKQQQQQQQQQMEQPSSERNETQREKDTFEKNKEDKNAYEHVLVRVCGGFIIVHNSIYCLFIRLLKTMKSKFSINIINEMLLYMQKNMKKYEAHLDKVYRLLKEDHFEDEPRKKNKNPDYDKELEETEDEEEKKKNKRVTFIKNSIYNIYNSNACNNIDILNRKSIKYTLEVWIYNLMCIFIRSRRSNRSEEQTKDIVTILNIIISIIPTIFVKYINFFYPYIHHQDISKEICGLLASIIPHCKNTLQMKLQFKINKFNHDILFHSNSVISRSYIHLLCTLYTYIFCDFQQFQTYLEEGIICVYKFKLCYTINFYCMRIIEFVRCYQRMHPEQKRLLKTQLKKTYESQLKHMRIQHDIDVCIDKSYIMNDVNNPDNYMLDTLIDTSLEDFVDNVNQYRKKCFEHFGITAQNFKNMRNSVWFLSIFMEFININKIMLNNINVQINKKETIDLLIPNWTEVLETREDLQSQLKNLPDCIANSHIWMKYIKKSDIVESINYYNASVLYFEHLYQMLQKYIDTWNTERIKNVIIEQLKKQEVTSDLNRINDLADFQKVQLDDIPETVLTQMIHILSLPVDENLKYFFVQCIQKILSNYYNSHLSSDERLKIELFKCMNTNCLTMHIVLLNSIYQLIVTYENFLNNRNDMIVAQHKATSLLTTSHKKGANTQELHPITIQGKRMKNTGGNNNAGRIIKKGVASIATKHEQLAEYNKEETEKKKKSLRNGKGSEEGKKSVTNEEIIEEQTASKQLYEKQQDEVFDKLVQMEQEKDIMNVLVLCSSFDMKILSLLRTNQYRYIKCEEEVLLELKLYGLRILNELYKLGSIQSSVITPYIFPLCFSTTVEIKTFSEKLIKGIVEKEKYAYVNNLGEWLQHLLFHIMENYYMNVSENNNLNMEAKPFLFRKMNISFFRFIVSLYDDLPNTKTKMHFLKTILKEIEHACQCVLIDKILNEINTIYMKYARFYIENYGAAAKSNPYHIGICDINFIYTFIHHNYLTSRNTPIGQNINSNISAANAKKPSKGKRKTVKKGKTYNNNNNNNNNNDNTEKDDMQDKMEQEVIDTVNYIGNGHVENASTKIDSDVDFDSDTCAEKIKDKYKFLVNRKFQRNNYVNVTYFACLYLQMLAYILSYLNYSTYNELIFLLNGIHQVYYIISSAINVNGSESSEKEKSEMNDYSKFLETMSNIDMAEETRAYNEVSIYLNKVKCIGMCLLDNISKNLVSHYHIDANMISEMEMEDNRNEKKIEDEKKDNKENIFNYYEYIYKCIEIYAENDDEIIEKYSKANLSINLGSGYEIMQDDKYMKEMSKKKKKRTTKKDT